LLGRATSDDIFKKLDQFIKVHGIEWKENVLEFASMEHVQ
jgi:hypothetical protein